MKYTLFVFIFVVGGNIFPSTMAFSQNFTIDSQSQTAMVMDLESNDPHRVSAALERLPDFYDDNSSFALQVSSQISSALMVALDNEIEIYREIIRGDRQESRMHELLFNIADVVIALKDPATIPLLMDLAHYGNAPVDALLEFGPQVIPFAMEYAMNSQRLDPEIDGSLRLLEKAIIKWGQPIPSLRAEIKNITLFYLNEYLEYYDGELKIPSATRSAMRLASVLGDMDLKESVKKFVAIEEVQVEFQRTYGADMPNFVQEILDNWEE